jgi:DNA-binding winged helix-turn-helix (wHTH) protein
MADLAAAQDPARGKPVKISARAFDVLVVLVRADGKAVSKASLLTQVSNEIVEENNLQAQISALRRLLGRDRHLLVTEFGCGYRFNIAGVPLQASPTRK